jgi:hypothetical protein
MISKNDDLFVRGAGRYLEGLAAIEALERQVQDACRKVYRQHAPELLKQMGLDSVECKPYADKEPGDGWAEVGIKRPAQKWCEFFLYLGWWDEAGEETLIDATIWLTLYHKSLRDEKYELFRKKNPRSRIAKGNTYALQLTLPIQPDGLGSADEILDGLMSEWLDCCKSVGGLALKQYKTP